MGDNIGTLFFKDKQVRLLLMLNEKNKEWYISDLAKQANVTYTHQQVHKQMRGLWHSGC